MIKNKYADHFQEYVIAINTGMRPSEQYRLTWDRVDLERRTVTIQLSKNGRTRYIPLNSVAIVAFKARFSQSFRPMAVPAGPPHRLHVL